MFALAREKKNRAWKLFISMFDTVWFVCVFFLFYLILRLIRQLGCNFVVGIARHDYMCLHVIVNGIALLDLRKIVK